jgi:hypothetical protein
MDVEKSSVSCPVFLTSKQIVYTSRHLTGRDLWLILAEEAENPRTGVRRAEDRTRQHRDYWAARQAVMLRLHTEIQIATTLRSPAWGFFHWFVVRCHLSFVIG